MSSPFPPRVGQRPQLPDGSGLRGYLTVPVIVIIVLVVFVSLAWPFR